jgi:hypothetical protein
MNNDTKVCVVLSCSMGYSLLWPKYNVIIIKSKTLWELECCFHDFIIQFFLELDHFGVEYFGKNNMKITIWDNTLMHSTMLSPLAKSNYT